MYRRQDDLEVTLRSRESCITALQNDIGTYKEKLNEAETKLQQVLSRSQTLEQELQVLKDKVSEVFEECQQKTDDVLHWQNEYAQVRMSVQTQWCVSEYFAVLTYVWVTLTFVVAFLHALVLSQKGSH
jgi:predicted  nucleic acid-binding Zn-ribbon protein